MMKETSEIIFLIFFAVEYLKLYQKINRNVTA